MAHHNNIGRKLQIGVQCFTKNPHIGIKIQQGNSRQGLYRETPDRGYTGKQLYTVNSAYNELLGTMRKSSLYPEFVITV